MVCVFLLNRGNVIAPCSENPKRGLMEGLDVDQVRNVQHQFITFISHTQCEQLLHIIYTLFIYTFISPFIYSFLLYTELF